MKQRIAEGVTAVIVLYAVRLIAFRSLPEREALALTWAIMCLMLPAVLRPHQTYPGPRRHWVGAIILFSSPLVLTAGVILANNNAGLILISFVFTFIAMIAGMFLFPPSFWRGGHGLREQGSLGRDSPMRLRRIQGPQGPTQGASEVESATMARKRARGAYRKMSTDTMLPRLRNSILPQLRTSRRKHEVDKRNGSI